MKKDPPCWGFCLWTGMSELRCLRTDLKASEKQMDSNAEHQQQDTTDELKMSKSPPCSCWRSSSLKVILSVCTAILLILSLVFIFLFVVTRRSPVKEAQQQFSDITALALCVPACPSGWIGYEGKCYFFSEGGRNWTSGQSFCASYNSSLAVIETETEKVFIIRYKCFTDHWIGLRKNLNHSWKWADGTVLNGTLEVKGEGGDCAFLNSGSAVSSRCHIQRNWICSHHDAYASHKNSSL